MDESIELFRGVELSKLCSNRLDEVEKKISVLIENEAGEITEEEITLSEAKHEKYNKGGMMDFNSKYKTYAELVNKALKAMFLKRMCLR